jgi:cell wall-associated NlpC family hydrolase
MSGSAKIAITAVVAVLLPVVLGAAAASAIASAMFGSGASSLGDCSPAAAVHLTGYQPDQMTNATTIVAIGTQLKVSQEGQVVAIAAALQESGLHNLDHGDRDSLGLFQQRPSQGWGTPAQIMNPSYAATKFYNHLLAIPGWQQLSVNDAAQAVQRSGFPNAYGPHEQAAREIVAVLSGSACEPGSNTTVAVLGTGDCHHIQAPDYAAFTAISFACKQVGQPYVWGGNGLEQSGGFDCSGLTTAAYAAAGIGLPRTADSQYRAGPHVPADQPLFPGDLVFFGNEQHVHHVGLYIGAGLMIDAPDVGETVKSQPYKENDYLGATRPASAVGA